MSSHLWFSLAAARRPFPALLLWCLLLVFFGFQAAGLGERLHGGVYEAPGSESARARALLARAFGRGERDNLYVLFRSRALAATDPAYRRRVEDLARGLEGHRAVDRIVTYYNTGEPAFLAPDGRTSYMVIETAGTEADVRDLVPEVRARAAAGGGPGADAGAFRAYVLGFAATTLDLERAGEEDLRRVEAVTLPVLFLLLVAAFGSLAAAAIPVALGVASVVVSLGILGWLAGRTEISIFAQNTATMIGLGIGVDYSLMVVSRLREELAGGAGVQAALASTFATAGRAVATSGCLVAAAMAALCFIDVMMVRSIALAILVVALVSVAVNLTLGPALLRLTAPGLGDAHWGRRLLRRLGFRWDWAAWAGRVMARPGPYLAASLLVTLALAAPAAGLRTGAPGMESLPAWTETRQGFQVLQGAFGPGALAPIQVVVHAGDAGGVARPRVVDALEGLAVRLRADHRVRGVARPMVDAAGRVAVLAIEPAQASTDRRTVDLVRELRDGAPGLLRAAGLGARAGDAVLVGGSTAGDMDFIRGLNRYFPVVAAAGLLFTFLLLLVVFRSLVIPAKAIAMNLLSLLAGYGTLVLVAQEGWGADLLGFPATGTITAMTPILLFAVLFSLSMDYEVFLLARIRESWLASGDNDASVGQGLGRTGGVVTTAGLIMIVVFVSFALSGVIVVKELGLGLAVSVLLDVTLVRMVLLPASMKLLGPWNWWLPWVGQGRRGAAGRARTAP